MGRQGLSIFERAVGKRFILCGESAATQFVEAKLGDVDEFEGE
jgi:hypothetical protein